MHLNLINNGNFLNFFNSGAKVGVEGRNGKKDREILKEKKEIYLSWSPMEMG
jgi:hypothetical protein